jgi:NAD(P)-dependent dehydrogenase (short-subunit alcohol dehydrogenase family)
MDLGMKGKVAIVTGGSEGIGKAADRSMAQEGANVVICARRQEVLTAAAKEIGEVTGNGAVLPIRGDVMNTADIERVVKGAVDRFGGVDILVNNAGMGAGGPFLELTDQQWLEDFDLKVWAAIRFARLTIPHMQKAGGGRIINVLNLAAKAPFAGSAPTSISRAAGMAITKVLSKEFARDNILSNCVLIGAVKSAQNDRQWEAAREETSTLTRDEFYGQMAVQRGCPMGRAG